MTPLDATLFPRAAGWLAQVPGGLKAYPECTARSDPMRLLLDEFPEIFAAGVSPGLKQSLTDAVRTQPMMPDAWGVLLRLMLRDRALDEQGFTRWHLDMAARVFATPAYRVLMHVLSPSLVLAGAQRRWNAFRTGTNLSSEGSKTGAKLSLTYPRLLYPEPVSRVYAESFRAALQAARANNVVIELTRWTETESNYALSWS